MGALAIGIALTACAGSEPRVRTVPERAAPGYRIELVSQRLVVPTGVELGVSGAMFVAPAVVASGEITTTVRLVEVDPSTGAVVREIGSGAHAPSDQDLHGGIACVVLRCGSRK